MEEYCWYMIYAHDVVVNHMILYIFYMIRLVSLRAFVFIGGVCDTHEIQAKPGNFIRLSHIGQSDLHITYYGLLCVWYTCGRQQM